MRRGRRWERPSVAHLGSEVLADLLHRGNVKHCSGAVEEHESIAVTERVIRTLEYEWLRWAARCRRSSAGGVRWQRPPVSAKRVVGTTERWLFPDSSYKIPVGRVVSGRLHGP